jgi:hypothetical protein
MNSVDKAVNVFALIVVLAMVAVIFKSPQTKSIIKNFGNLFQGSITAAEHG